MSGSSRRTGRRAGRGLEFELLDTGIFDQDRYFDIQIEYAKRLAEDICIRVEALNRGPESGAASPDPAAVVSEHMVLG